MAARDKAVVGGPGVHIEGGLGSHGELDYGGVAEADRAGLAAHPIAHVAPVVPSLDVAAVQVNIRLSLRVAHCLRVLPRHDQGVQANRALGSAGVEIVHQQLELPVGRASCQACAVPPDQGCPADVHEGAVDQLA